MAARDQEWFRGIYHDNYRPLLAYARRRTDAATADDIVADAFLTAWRRRDDIPDGAERLWLFGVARNLIRSAARSERRRRAAQARLELVRPPEADDPAAVASDERSTLLRAALDALSEADREVLMLAAWEELRHAEIGQVLDISANAAAIRVHRARKRLAAQLDRLQSEAQASANGENVKPFRRRGHMEGQAAERVERPSSGPHGDASGRRAGPSRRAP